MEFVGRELSGAGVKGRALRGIPPRAAGRVGPGAVHTPWDILKGGGGMAISPSSSPQSARGACKPQGPHSAQKTRDFSYRRVSILR